MNIPVKKGRIWLPNSKELRGKFLEISISTQEGKASFIIVIPKDGRFYIPLKIRESLRIKKEVSIDCITEIKNLKRNKRLLKNKFLDILSIIPKKTISGYEIMVMNKENKYLCWYCTQGRPSELLIEKMVPLEFSRFLGYYQAEGGKLKLTNRRGRTFSFANTKIELIQDFIRLSEKIINKELWNASIRHHESMKKEELDALIPILEKEGIDKNKIRLSPVKNIKRYSIVLWISNSLLSEIIDNMNNQIKDLILKTNNEIIFEEYFKGVVAGDGNFFSYRDKNGSLHSWLSIYEEKENYIKSYEKMLNRYNLSGKIMKDKNKNLYTLRITANWDKLLDLLKYNIFLYASKHKSKLLWAIKNHKRYKSLKHLIKLKEKFNIKNIKNLSNKDYSYSAHWIQKRIKEGILMPSLGNDGNYWQLTKKGIETKKILKQIE